MEQEQCLGTIWVCSDCMLVHANGECGEDTDREPWGLLKPGQTVTMGLPADEHSKYCAVRKTGRWPNNYECDCERNDFSTSPCEGCGSYLHGDRYAFGLWETASV